MATTLKGQKEIAEKTMNEVRTFLSGILYGTDNHESIYKLTEQMTHDYSNRFIIELLQNAYDALPRQSHDTTNQGKIKIVLSENEDKSSTLYFANNGTSFTYENFKALSSIALSNKDPKEAIGNKGIGFKSVLQVCNAPKVYSGNWNETDGYLGYCFEYNPNKVLILKDYLVDIFENSNIPTFNNFCNVNEPIIDWDEKTIANYKQKVLQKDNPYQYIDYVVNHFSPYQLPFPIYDQSDPIVNSLGQEGFATVIKLELTEEKALDNTKFALLELKQDSLMFLDYLTELTIEHIGAKEEPLDSNIIKSKSKKDISTEFISVSHVQISNTHHQQHDNYFIFTSEIGGINHPQKAAEISKCAEQLPGAWGKINNARLNIAVPLYKKHEKGKMYIYLPTKQSSNMGIHINAPFFGQMNRKDIDFSIPLNHLYLREMTELIYLAVEYLKEHKPPQCENMIVDLLSFPNDSTEITSILFSELSTVLEKRSTEIKKWGVLPHVNRQNHLCFGNLTNTYLLPSDWPYKIFSKETLIQELEFQIVSAISNDRLILIEKFATLCGYCMEPKNNVKANWIEAIAEYLLNNKVPIEIWQQYYEELVNFVPSYDVDGKRILLGEDEKLHTVPNEDSNTFVFFPPSKIKEANKPEPFSNVRVPAFLSDRIAFFNTKINLYKVEKGHRKNSSLYHYLDDIIKDFNVENILDKVIIPEMPKEDIPLNTELSSNLFDLLEWAMALYFRSSQLESVRRKFSNLFLPCQNSWKKASTIYFSHSWDTTSSVNYGELIEDYFHSFKNGPYKFGIEKLIIDFDQLPNRIKQFSHENAADFFAFCGVVDHLRLVPAIAKNKSVKVIGEYKSFTFPFHLEGNFSAEQIQIYREYVNKQKSYYSGKFRYEISNLETIEGIQLYNNLSNDGKSLFAKLILISISKWAEDWQTVILKKTEGGANWSKRLNSLVLLTLKTLAWLPVANDKSIKFVTPMELWYIPSTILRSASYSYSYIPHLSFEYAKVMEEEKSIRHLQTINLKNYEITTVNECIHLLNDLAELLAVGKVPFELINYYKRDIRYAWGRLLDFYEENRDEFEDISPPKKVVTLNKDQLSVCCTEDDETIVYIPDDKKLFMQLQSNPKIKLLFMEPGKKLVSLLTGLFGKTFPLLSDLTASIKVDGAIWTKEKTKDVNTFFIDENREWLLPYIITIVIYREESQLSINSKSFKDLIITLKRAKWVGCNELIVSLQTKEGIPIERKEESIVFCKETESFLVSLNKPISLEDFATPIRDLLGNASLELPLKYVLSKLDEEFPSEPLEQAIITSLETIKITEEDFYTVKALINDDIDWVLKLMLPTIYAINGAKKIIDPSELPMMESEECLKNSLGTYVHEPFRLNTLIQLTKESKNIVELGQKLYSTYHIDLFTWNSSIKLVSQKYKTIINEDIEMEFLQLKERYQNVVLAIFRHNHDNLDIPVTEYKSKKELYHNWSMPHSWVERYWSLSESLFLKELEKALPSINITLYGEAYEEITKEVFTQSIDITPVHELIRQNYQLLKQVVQKIQLSVIGLCQFHKKDIPPYWLQTEQTIIDHIQDGPPEELLELMKWHEGDTLGFISLSTKFMGHFKDVINPYPHIQSLQDVFSILEQETDKEDLNEVIEKEKEKKRKEKRLVKINGQFFDTDESNLENLGQVMGSFDLNALQINGSFGKPMDLKAVKEKNKHTFSMGDKKGKKGRTKRISRHIENVIGLSGELLIDFYLRNSYPGVYSPEYWKSENSSYAYPLKEINDSLGYDFELREKNKTYHIEVKASMDAKYSFNMGTSETQKALEDVKKKNVEYIIVYIANIFEAPEIYWLPNPFSNKGTKVYKMADAGVKVSFHIE